MMTKGLTGARPLRSLPRWVPSKKPYADRSTVAGKMPGSLWTLARPLLQAAAALDPLMSAMAAARLPRSCLQASWTAAQVDSDPVLDHVGPAHNAHC